MSRIRHDSYVVDLTAAARPANYGDHHMLLDHWFGFWTLDIGNEQDIESLPKHGTIKLKKEAFRKHMLYIKTNNLIDFFKCPVGSWA